jgi:hypothetical protein
MRNGPVRPRSRFRWALVAVLVLSGAALGCSDDDGGGGDAASTTADPDPSAPTTEGEERTTSTAASPALVLVTTTTSDTTEPPGTATTLDPAAPTTAVPTPVRVYELDWSKLTLPPWFGYDDVSNPADPFWHLHNQADEGFFLSLEMYTTGFGSTWTGEAGEFDLGCSGDGSGICIHFDPDGHGEEYGDLNADFTATGRIEIAKLDEEGYDLVLSNVVFSDGATIPGHTRLSGDVTAMDPAVETTDTEDGGGA